MPQKILIKRSSVAAKVPTAANLVLGELALNTYDGRLYTKKNNGTDVIVQIGPVTSVAGREGDVIVTKADVGLGNADNTSDALKPVSTATRTALNLKADITYVDTKVAALVDSSPSTLDTLNELAAALGDDPNFATTTATSLGNRVRTDTAAQGLTAQQKTNAKTNLDLNNVENKSSATIRSEITATNIAQSLGYRPMVMGAGLNQVGNDVKIGWLTGARLGLTVDVTDFADIWPININGSAKTLDGQNAAYYSALANSTGVLAIAKGGTGSTTVAGARSAFELDNVDNTADLNKPISTATQNALNTKAASNGNSSNDFSVKMLYASSGVVANGHNTIRMFGANTGVAPGIAAEGLDENVGIYYGTKGTGYHMFAVGQQHHLTIGGNPGTVVNRHRIYGGLTGQNAVMVVEGADANIGMDFNAKGAGEFIYRSNGGIQFAITSTASAVNFPKVIAAATSNGVTFAAEGTDTNVNVHLRSKGGGAIALQSSSGGNAFVANAAAGSVNWLTTTAAPAGQAPTLSPQGSDANLDLVLVPKGLGAVRATAQFAAPGITLSHSAPVIHFFESDQINADGVWRQVSDGGALRFDRNTSTTRNFATYDTPMTFLKEGGMIIGRKQEVNLNIMAGNRFFGFSGGGATPTTVGAPDNPAGAYDALGLQMDQVGQRSQMAFTGSDLMIRTDDTLDGQNGWGAWKTVHDDSNLTKLSQLQNDLPVPAINPATPKDGDIRVAAGPIISIYATGAWRQIFPAVYS